MNVAQKIICYAKTLTGPRGVSPGALFCSKSPAACGDRFLCADSDKVIVETIKSHVLNLNIYRRSPPETFSFPEDSFCM